MNVLWETVERLRKSKGLTLKDLGKLCEIKPQGVQTWKNTGRIPVEHLNTLATYFGVSIDHLLGRDIPNKNRTIYKMPAVDGAPVREYQGVCQIPDGCDLPGRLASMEVQISEIRTQMSTLLGLLGASVRDGVNFKNKKGAA